MSSSLIGVLWRHCADIDSTCPDPDPPRLTCLVDVLGRIPDPRRVRGRRYRLGFLLTVCLGAVLSGATSLAAMSAYTSTRTIARQPRQLHPPVAAPPWTRTSW
ncbi:transposase family protein [Streptomyces sp. NPDC004976]